MPYAVLLQHLGHSVHRIALGNAAQVDLYGGVFAGETCRSVQLQAVLGGHRQGLACFADRLCVGCVAHRAKSPGIDQRPHAWVECAIAQPLDFERTVQNFQDLRGQGHPVAHGCVVQAHEVTVGLPGRHLRIHLLHGSGQVLAQDVQLRLG